MYFLYQYRHFVFLTVIWHLTFQNYRIFCLQHRTRKKSTKVNSPISLLIYLNPTIKIIYWVVGKKG